MATSSARTEWNSRAAGRIRHHDFCRGDCPVCGECLTCGSCICDDDSIAATAVDPATTSRDDQTTATQFSACAR